MVIKFVSNVPSVVPTEYALDTFPGKWTLAIYEQYWIRILCTKGPGGPICQLRLYVLMTKITLEISSSKALEGLHSVKTWGTGLVHNPAQVKVILEINLCLCPCWVCRTKPGKDMDRRMLYLH